MGKHPINHDPEHGDSSRKWPNPGPFILGALSFLVLVIAPGPFFPLFLLPVAVIVLVIGVVIAIIDYGSNK